ncbi:HNH endonuclease [Variovorax sp. LG9.2]|uniref:HNH endonuclease n=1 Tax=Variovorax sp. LG9.2 TaxID=3048626 RepID=UPI002B22E8D7|nr:HNH endonuclease [Variovorax sp. LG9.2]MEB0060103.1 HNH endonuclease domain-containing protein [Variovorax sp. LG9.2]
MSTQRPPSPEEQLSFLAKLQRLFAEGDFTATYKFALLIALADLAVELGNDDGQELLVTTRQIGERFVQLYWQQAAPYAATSVISNKPAVLVQNNGAQAAVVNLVKAFREQTCAATAQQGMRNAAYPALLASVTRTVSEMPLKRLQKFGGGTDEFLYARRSDGLVGIKPASVYCLRRFQPLVQQLARSHWVDHIKANRMNLSVLGPGNDLEDFLFSSSRQSLLILGQGLRKVDGSRCFYCGQTMTGADVDHFIPFSLYPRDVGQNFVLSHPSCNRSKSSTLAARGHLERWLQRLDTHADNLLEIGAAAGMPSDPQVSRQVANWGYANAIASGAHAWRSARDYELISPGYADCFAGQCA